MHSSDNKGPILAFFCNWAPYRCYMDLCKSGKPLPRPIYPLKVMCTGRIDPAMVLLAFEKGAEGVVVLGCKDNECQYGPGPGQVSKMAKPVQKLIHILGLEPERFSTLAYSSDEKKRLLEEMGAFAQRISRIKKSPFA